MPLGAIPAGTGNAVAKSLLHAAGEQCSPLAATLAFVCGRRLPMDVMEVRPGPPRNSSGASAEAAAAAAEVPESGVSFCLLSVAWGLIADIDIESETMRAFGALRLTIQARRVISCCRCWAPSVSRRWLGLLSRE